MIIANLSIVQDRLIYLRLIKHEIKIVFEEFEDKDEDFEIFREGFLRFLKDNPLILRENDKYIEVYDVDGEKYIRICNIHHRQCR